MDKQDLLDDAIESSLRYAEKCIRQMKIIDNLILENDKLRNQIKVEATSNLSEITSFYEKIQIFCFHCGYYMSVHVSKSPEQNAYDGVCTECNKHYFITEKDHII